MSACGYEFNFLVFKSISHSFVQKIRIHVRACNILYIFNSVQMNVVHLVNRHCLNNILFNLVATADLGWVVQKLVNFNSGLNNN